MKINRAKTVSVIITCKRSPLLFQYCINDVQLCNIREYKYLGVYIQSNLSWNLEVDKVYNKAYIKAVNLTGGLVNLF